MSKGVGLVISPLISLMQNQVEALRANGVRAAFLNSSLSPAEQAGVIQLLGENKLDLLYLAPERLMTESFLELLKTIDVGLVAIDEAHCVSQWGHDFRPEYLQLSVLSEIFPEVSKIALTATADPPTQREILSRLNMGEAKVFSGGFDRPNISYSISLKNSVKKQILDFIESNHAEDSGIIYCLSRKKTEECAEWLTEAGKTALPYHAGLPSRVKEKNQRRFLNEEGVIVVATIAFGMGIDKPNVRFVVHADLPKSIESYYQETGRAGRDGLAASAWMAYGLKDIALLRNMIASSDAPEERKRVEQLKLNSLVGLCETSDCRRKVLLGYFADETVEKCGNCDTCLEPVESWDGTKEAQMALSAVYRTGQRFGTGYLGDFLAGKTNERMSRFGHDRLEAFGVGNHLKQADWTSIYRQLVAMNYLRVDIDGYGGLSLLPEARIVLKGEKEICFRKDSLAKRKGKPKTSRPAATLDLSDSDKAVFEQLRKHRLELSKKEGVPPYVIFHDKTLQELCLKRPKTLVEMLEVSGVGEKKAEKYGEQFLAMLRECPEKSQPS